MKSKKDGHIALARKRELIVKELTDEVLVYDLSDNRAHSLNHTAAFVWKHCDGEKTVPEIASLMEMQWSKPVSEDVVWLALKQLSRAGLLEEPVAPDAGGMRASRRAVLRKLGAAAAMTPLVISIVAPTASAGASVPPVCVCCTVLGSGAGRTNTCPPICNDIPGCCFNNSSCSTGAGGLLATGIGCTPCFENFPSNPTSSGWRAIGANCSVTVPKC